jgi:hypothetical protein
MANDCYYDMCAVAPKRETLERLIEIMNYNDDEYYIYRVFQANPGEIEFEDDLYTVRIQGYVAWSCNSWFETRESIEQKVCLGWDKYTHKEIYGNAHYITLDLLCERLDFGVEVYSEESGIGFQAYNACNHKGELQYDVADWSEQLIDDEGNWLDEPIVCGGLPYYDEFNSIDEIYGVDN